MNNSNSSGENDTQKAQFNLTPEKLNSFEGRVHHKDILSRLTQEFSNIDLRVVLGLKDENLTQKHKVFGVVKHILKTAKDKTWNFCKAYESTYIYNGEFWKYCSKEDIKKFLSDVAIKMGLPDFEAKHHEFADKLLKQFLSDAHFPTREKESNKILVNLLNGTFEFTSSGFKKRAFNPDDFLTYQLPFAYEPSASCTLFDSYLMKVLPHESSRKLLQDFVGYIFTNLNLEKCLVLTGGGQNGKSVFMNVLCALIGKENTLHFSMGHFAQEYNRAQLVNVLLNYSSEKGFDLNPDIFKALVSAEPIQAREIYQKPFTLYNKTKFISNCNELPKETESTEAYFRRFLIVPFEVTIPENEKDITLADKIIANELPGVFNWLLVGLNRIKEQKRFTDCDRAKKALLDFRKQSDSVQLFVEDSQLQTSEQNKMALTDIYRLYKEFCYEDGYKQLGKNKFSIRLERQGFQKTRMNNGSTAFLIDRKQGGEF